jgi:hypothetical protein
MSTFQWAKRLTLGAALAVCVTRVASAENLDATSSQSFTGAGGNYAASVSADEATGGASYHYPIALPPARGLGDVGLAITYSSGSGDREAGYGWGLNLPTIERRRPVIAPDDPQPRPLDPDCDIARHPTTDDVSTSNLLQWGWTRWRRRDYRRKRTVTSADQRKSQRKMCTCVARGVWGRRSLLKQTACAHPLKRSSTIAPLTVSQRWVESLHHSSLPRSIRTGTS